MPRAAAGGSPTTSTASRKTPSRERDPPAGFSLTADAVLRVARLAEQDRSVYRYIRRVFSPRFTPIDAGNVWHAILPAVRSTDTWQRLTERAARDEARASARTKAGHARRTPDGSERQKYDTTGKEDNSPSANHREGNQATTVGENNTASETIVGRSNNGLASTADLTNSGFVPEEASIDDQTNEAPASAVGQSNPTYDQSGSTTTTTDFTEANADEEAGDERADPSADLDPQPVAEAAVIGAFEAANGRAASQLERELLGDLALAFDTRARRAGADGYQWVTAAIREAVGSGSRFVAPKRIREILSRWAKAEDHRVRPGAAPASATLAGDGYPDFAFPSGGSSRVVWRAVLDQLGASLDAGEMERLFAGSGIVRYAEGVVTIGVASEENADRLRREYGALVARKLTLVLGRPVRLRFEIHADAPRSTGESLPADPSPEDPHRGVTAERRLPPSRSIPRFSLPGGLTNVHLWAMAQEDLERRLSRASWESWIRPVMLIGMENDGRTLVLGAPNAFARQRIESRLLPLIEETLAALLGRPVTARVEVASAWQPAGESGGDGV